jgi:hypothetical protein
VEYAVEMGSGAMIYIPSFIRAGSGIEKLMGGGENTRIRRPQGDLLSLFYFFFNKESGLKMEETRG